MKNLTVIVIALLTLFIVGISVYTYESEENIIEEVSGIAETNFYGDSEVEATYDSSSFSFYLPEGLQVDEEDANNAVLHSGDQTYIVFYNKFEEPNSQLNYTNAKNEQAILYESFEDESKFGYVRVIPSEENNYELQIGIGGVKITTYTTRAKIDRDTEELMKIARSIIESEESV